MSSSNNNMSAWLTKNELVWPQLQCIYYAVHGKRKPFTYIAAQGIDHADELLTEFKRRIAERNPTTLARSRYETYLRAIHWLDLGDGVGCCE